MRLTPAQPCDTRVRKMTVDMEVGQATGTAQTAVIMQCNGTRGRSSSTSGLAHVHTAADDPSHHRGHRESQHGDQVRPRALAAASGQAKWSSRGPRVCQGSAEHGPLTHKPGIQKAKCVIPSPAHLRDTHRTFTTFIMGKNFATTLGIKSKITTEVLGPGGA